MNRPSFAVVFALSCTLVGVAPAQTAPPAAESAQTAPAVVRQYAAIVHAAYEDSLAGARSLRQAVDAFAARPTAAGLQTARERWLAARTLYGQTEAFRFYGGPIDAENGPEGRINAWPIDESFIDAVADKPNAGIVGNRKIAIDKRTLAAHNERGGEENVATGWHAIEFLLWGQDRSESGPGDRSFADYVDGKDPNADRRRRYLQVAAELLVDDLAGLVAAWAPGADNYRRGFERGGNESLRKVFVGLGSLSRGELAGERLEVALASRDQEDEQSCFSDSTHADVVANALGIENVWLGRYVRADGRALQGASLRDLVAQKDAALAERTTTQIAASLAAARAIRAPFDREIAGGADGRGRERIERTVASLREQSKSLVDAAAALGISRLNLAQPKAR